MPRRTRARETVREDKFPQLEEKGLFPSKIDSDGNCLFRALSDQWVGHQELHEEIRAKVFAFMRANPDDYKPFVDVPVQGNGRRNSRRKAAGSRLQPLTEFEVEAAAIDQAWENHLAEVAKLTIWGGDMELGAFSRAYNMKVKVWSTTSTVEIDNTTAREEGPVKTLHIALHTWRHYSSVRKVAGPLEGLPDLNLEGVDGPKAKPSAAVSSRPSSVERGNDDEATGGQSPSKKTRLSDDEGAKARRTPAPAKPAKKTPAQRGRYPLPPSPSPVHRLRSLSPTLSASAFPPPFLSSLPPRPSPAVPSAPSASPPPSPLPTSPTRPAPAVASPPRPASRASPSPPPPRRHLSPPRASPSPRGRSASPAVPLEFKKKEGSAPEAVKVSKKRGRKGKAAKQQKKKPAARKG
ncbi:MAG: hypothetical protein M1814_000218 [Vezdaea aestivalis]|nr:MAG: hypothetical protein M1814_000218 [Vezdaea aestivalis]